MEDLRLYKASGVYGNTDKTCEIMELVEPDEVKAASIEVIGGKVVKFFLTSKGSDAFNPEYGGVSMHHTQISEQYFQQLVFEVKNDIDACIAFIKNAEVSANVEGEKLSTIILNKMTYDRSTRDKVDVYLEIVTTYDKHAIVAITNKTDS